MIIFIGFLIYYIISTPIIIVMLLEPYEYTETDQERRKDIIFAFAIGILNILGLVIFIIYAIIKTIYIKIKDAIIELNDGI